METNDFQMEAFNGQYEFKRQQTVQYSILQHYNCPCVCSCHLLFEVSSILFINQHQVQEVTHRKFLVDVPHGGCQVIA